MTHTQLRSTIHNGKVDFGGRGRLDLDHAAGTGTLTMSGHWMPWDMSETLADLPASWHLCADELSVIAEGVHTYQVSSEPVAHTLVCTAVR